MFYNKEFKKDVQKRLKGVAGIGVVLNMMSNGAPLEEVEARITALLQAHHAQQPQKVDYNTQPAPYQIFGRALIPQNAVDDMDTVMRLPFVTDGALMPDAHRTAGGHTPVGSVVRTAENIIVPDIVSADIACSVTLTVFATDWDEGLRPQLENLLKTKMYFGAQYNPDPIGKTRAYYTAFPTLRSEVGKRVEAKLLETSVYHFGTSGDGNHFGEFGLTNEGKLAFLTHYGSRGVGAVIHRVFNEWVKQGLITPNGANTPLDTTTPEGADYAALLLWAGDFTFESHDWLSAEMEKHLNTTRQTFIHSRHNFAWLDETTGGWIHRKGATPVEAGQLGVIPATMGHKTKIVSGLGNKKSLSSASHGSGRTHSRSEAMEAFGKTSQKYITKTFGITLIGGGADEDPRAYKPIDEVMDAQQECAVVVGEFTPKVVRMAQPKNTSKI